MTPTSTPQHCLYYGIDLTCPWIKVLVLTLSLYFSSTDPTGSLPLFMFPVAPRIITAGVQYVFIESSANFFSPKGQESG